jgi:signal transduction histidine kinase
MNAVASQPPTTVRWHNSLIARIVALCAILVMCLLGSVYVLTGHFIYQIRKEMEARIFDMAKQAEYYFQEQATDSSDLESAQKNLGERYPGVSLNLADATDVHEATGAEVRVTDEGMVITGSHLIERQGLPPARMVVRFTIKTQSAVVRAFKNQYMAALTAGFLITLGLMIYFIVKSLRPLRDLSESCARISQGELRPVEIKRNYGEILSLEQTFNRMVASLREKEQMEANLRQAQRLSALGSLAAGVAHDVRNPLNSIKLLSSHALDTLGDDRRSAAAAEHLRTIHKEVNRIEDIVTGFLALAKERELQLEPIPVDSLLEECLRLVRADAEASGVRLLSELRLGDTTLELDKKQVTRAILNVLLNALEACPVGGRVRMFSRLNEKECQIEIRDDGPGMSKEVAERAFDPYFTTKPTGTGIGLSITRGIIEEHGGTIGISSSEGQGCQVLITFPLAPKAKS